MKNKLFFVFVLTISLFSSCQKRDENNNNGIPINIFSKIRNELKEQPAFIGTLSYLYQNNAQIQEGHLSSWALNDVKDANLTVNGKVIPKIMTKTGAMIFSTIPPRGSLNTRDDLTSLYGQNLSFNLNSPELGNVTGTFRSPEFIRCKINDSENLPEISKSTDLKVTWNKDELNKLPVLINIKKIPKPGDINTDIIQVNKEVNDNGILYIKSSDLQVFGVGDFIDVSVLRGNYAISETANGKKAVFNAISESVISSTVKR
jgi:hypothetical protein